MSGPDQSPTPALTKLTDQAVIVEGEIRQKEAELKELKALRFKLLTQQIPELMQEYDLESITCKTGMTIKLADYISGSLPKDETERAVAFKWLERNDGDGIIKSEVITAFGRDDLDRAKDLEQRIKSQGYAASLKESVHPQTLYAWCRERLREGKQVDFDTLGLNSGVIAKIK